MCDAASVVRVLQIGAGAAGQAQYARDTRRNALEADAFTQRGLFDRVTQENQADTDRMVARSRDAMREVGAFNAIFADSGLDGNSHDRIVAEAEGAAREDITTLRRNQYLRINQGNAEVGAMRAQTQSRINAAARPSLIGTGLQIAGAVAKPRAKE